MLTWVHFSYFIYRSKFPANCQVTWCMFFGCQLDELLRLPWWPPAESSNISMSCEYWYLQTVFSIPVSLLYSVGNKTYYLYTLVSDLRMLNKPIPEYFGHEVNTALGMLPSPDDYTSHHTNDRSVKVATFKVEYKVALPYRCCGIVIHPR